MHHMNKSFNDQLLLEFMSNFYGYGDYNGAYWFVGMEEGGGDSFDEVAKRLSVWDRRGRNELEDVVDYHLQLGVDYPFRENPRLQPTWAKLIRILLSSEGHEPTKEDVRAYQQRCWARRSGNVCLLELLPLPSPSTNHWLYAEHTTLPSLASRELYRQTWSRRRVEQLQRHIATNQPKTVVFYSFGYLPYWNQIAGGVLEPVHSGDFYLQQRNRTVFVVVKHPAATGVSSEYFHAAGRIIRSALAGQASFKVTA
jgi:hypothetical protein